MNEVWKALQNTKIWDDLSCVSTNVLVKCLALQDYLQHCDYFHMLLLETNFDTVNSNSLSSFFLYRLLKMHPYDFRFTFFPNFKFTGWSEIHAVWWYWSYWSVFLEINFSTVFRVHKNICIIRYMISLILASKNVTLS